jgi:isoleucyl-tRNA synthetase
MAPILSFTAEEAWRIVHPGDVTIFTRTWKDGLPALSDGAALLGKWSRILAVRAIVQKELEAVRQTGAIGSSLQAEVEIVAGGDDYAALASLGDDLRFVLITSAAQLRRGDALAIAAASSLHAKCERCWHWRADVGSDPAHPGLCGRCLSNLYGAGEVRRCA